VLEERDAFLPNEILKEGHKLHREEILAAQLHCLVEAEGSDEVQLMVLLARKDITGVAIELTWCRDVVQGKGSSADAGKH
jgi:hypothetical protein